MPSLTCCVARRVHRARRAALAALIPRISFRQWHAWLTLSGLCAPQGQPRRLPRGGPLLLSPAEARRVFLRAVPLAVEPPAVHHTAWAAEDGQRLLGFADFIEAVCRVAQLVADDDSCPLDVALLRLLERLQRSPLQSVLRRVVEQPSGRAGERRLRAQLVQVQDNLEGDAWGQDGGGGKSGQAGGRKQLGSIPRGLWNELNKQMRPWDQQAAQAVGRAKAERAAERAVKKAPSASARLAQGPKGTGQSAQGQKGAGLSATKARKGGKKSKPRKKGGRKKRAGKKRAGKCGV